MNRLLVRPFEIYSLTSILHPAGASPAGDQTLVDHWPFACRASSHKILQAAKALNIEVVAGRDLTRLGERLKQWVKPKA